MRLAVIGGNGFVGSAFIRESRRRGYAAVNVTRDLFDREADREWDLIIDAAGNSVKYLAEREPEADFERSVTHKMRVLTHFRAKTHLHISSVDLYDDLSSAETTRENSPAGHGSSHYGFHKWLAEEIVRRYAKSWMIVRLAGMVGPGLKKNPVYDILHDQPVRIHPDSQYQFMSTEDVAGLTLNLWELEQLNEVFNVCGKGLASPREISVIAGRKLLLSEQDDLSKPRVVDINIQKLEFLMPVPETLATIRRFIQGYSEPPGA